MGLLNRKFEGARNRGLSTVADLLFFLPLCVWSSTWILMGHTSFSMMLYGFVSAYDIRYCCLACLALREVLFGEWNRLSFVGLVVALFMVLLAYFPNTDLRMIETICFVIAGRNIQFRKTAFVMFVLLGVLVVTTILSSQIGVLPDYVTESDRGPRHYLGFGWPNTGPALVFAVICLYLYLRGKSLKVLEGVVMLALSYCIYMATGCRTMFIIMLFVIAAALIAKGVPERLKDSKALGAFIAGVIPLIGLSSIVLCIAFNPEVSWMLSVDQILAGRVHLGQWAINGSGINVVGAEVKFTPMSNYNIVTGEWVQRNDAHPVDNVYVNMAVRYGALFLAASLVLVSVVQVRAHLHADWVLCAVVIGFALYGIAEYTVFSLYFNPFLMLIGGLFSEGEWNGEGRLLGRSASAP